MDPDARYTSALAFAADLNAFLEGKPVLAEAEVDVDDEATRRLHVRTEQGTRTTRVTMKRALGGPVGRPQRYRFLVFPREVAARLQFLVPFRFASQKLR